MKILILMIPNNKYAVRYIIVKDFLELITSKYENLNELDPDCVIVEHCSGLSDVLSQE